MGFGGNAVACLLEESVAPVLSAPPATDTSLVVSWFVILAVLLVASPCVIGEASDPLPPTDGIFLGFMEDRKEPIPPFTFCVVAEAEAVDSTSTLDALASSAVVVDEDILVAAARSDLSSDDAPPFSPCDSVLRLNGFDSPLSRSPPGFDDIERFLIDGMEVVPFALVASSDGLDLFIVSGLSVVVEVPSTAAAAVAIFFRSSSSFSF
mmetsp:Transcript_7850/g.17101  ORF Transcript_7850/g.17101 Transcript_7850/m.17101 type:complete len:208 (+) Transcript_7850:482-1105(+)